MLWVLSVSPSVAMATVYAFANASPILTYDRPATSSGRPENFEFGEAYVVGQQTAGFVRIRLASGAMAYVRTADVTLVTSPRWLATTSGYNTTEREFVRFWNKRERLKEFLGHPTTPDSQWDYEEYFDNAPAFQLRLPVIQSDNANVLGRDIPIVSAMVPISREMYHAFASERTGFDKKINLYLVADVSDSTREFLEGAVGGITRMVTAASFRDRINEIIVTTFGLNSREKSVFHGKVSAKDLAGFSWHRRGGQTAGDERGPLVDGLVAMRRGIHADGAATILVVMSRADVEFFGTTNASRSRTIENLELKLPADSVGVFAQITPEPGDDLRYVSRRLRGLSHMDYLEYSDTMADDLSSIVRRLAETPTSAVKGGNMVASAAQSKKMMGFLPRVLTSTANLPGGGAEADWRTIHLWLAVDELIWKLE